MAGKMAARKKTPVVKGVPKRVPISVIGKAIMRKYKKAFRVLSHY